MKFVLIGLAVVVAAILAIVAAVLFWSGAKLSADAQALSRVELQPLAGTVVRADAVDASGNPVPLAIRGNTLMPRGRLRAGERLDVDVVVRRPGWLSWALGRERHIRISTVTPSSQIVDRWPTASEAHVSLRFTEPVAYVTYRLPGSSARKIAVGGRETVEIAVGARQSGSMRVSSAARTWEQPGQPVDVTWFPNATKPVLLARPAAGSVLSPLEPIRLTLSKPVADVFGSAKPTVAASRGRWSEPDSHTLVFTPSGLGAKLGSTVRMRLPRAVATGATIQWTVPSGSTLRLQQLLAEQGYLPVDWIPAGAGVRRTTRAELAAAVAPPAGRFAWRYPNTPPELKQLWAPGQPNQVTRGAVMMFEDEHHLAVDALAGPQVWRALIADAVAAKHHSGGYSYVYVHRNVPQHLTLWHNGNVVLTSPGNTGAPAAPTQLGTWPVFEHIPVGTMSGTNPDGSHYHDPGIRWISYFHGGEALHEFPRASFGTPQSLGCVELPEAAAAQVWPYTPIGTLVTIEA